MSRIKSVGNKIEISEFTCDNCGSVIEYTKADIKENGQWHRTGVNESEWNGYEYVVCPMCNNYHKTNITNRSY